jgi:hypothetical protein
MVLDKDKWTQVGDKYYQNKPDMFGKRRVARIADFGKIEYLDRLSLKELPIEAKQKIPKQYLAIKPQANNYDEKAKLLGRKTKRKSVWTWGHPGRRDNQYAKKKERAFKT